MIFSLFRRTGGLASGNLLKAKKPNTKLETKKGHVFCGIILLKEKKVAKRVIR